jgi:threonine dehydratase
MPLTTHEVAARAVQARARIRSHIYETPMIPARSVGKSTGASVLFKAENYQLTGSFKLRGATSKLSAAAGSERLITASSGNHGIGSAHAAKSLNRNVTVVLPETVPEAKLTKIRSYGVEVILHGGETGLAEQHAQTLAASGAYTYISPYNDIDIVAGQGTIGLEILEQCADAETLNVFIAMGGGGLISGIGSVIKSFRPSAKIFGVSATNSMALAASMVAGRVVETEHKATLAEAVAGGIDEDTITLELATAVVDEAIECDEGEIAAALKRMVLEENMFVEGAAALALAGYDKVAERLKGQTSVIILCGGNVDPGVVRDIVWA